MAKIAIINDESEVVALIFQFLTHGHHEFLKMAGNTAFVAASVVAFQPEVIVLPLYRTREALGRPVTDYRRDIQGARLLERLADCPELAAVPIIVFGLSTVPDDMPEAFRARVHFSDFLLFPEDLQLLNPIISGYVGSASGSDDDFARLKRTIDELERQAEAHDPTGPPPI
jgi:hypothetical protein